ncbi:putative transcription regulator, MarR [Cupriavidus taiwanensis]|uniref:Transcription regulator, MarR n=1 Tax=Cupriavidus taiwanensis TaxID=164546 RepID=A0A976A8W1_9BURK|nr:MarR family transcriptional regulator [Cupriavidus taiwanensis]SOY68597.1 putative transcription regulator, MarR [Cupriavidus taiwanensis]
MRKTTTKRGATAKSTAAVPAPGEGKRGESGHLGYLLRQASASNRLRMERALADLNVTPPQFVVLTMLGAYPGLSGADLARLALLTPQTVSVIVGNLEKAGHIERAPHPVHGRIQTIGLTAQGKVLLGQCRARVMANEARLAAGLTAQEEEVIRRWLVAVAVDAAAAGEAAM